MAILEDLAYQIARGWARGQVEGIAAVWERAQKGIDEAPGPLERDAALRFRYAVQRMLPSGHPPVSEYTPQDSQSGNPAHMGQIP